jgi:hypothetical protein
MLSVIADGKNLAPFVILTRKNLLKERIPSGIILRHNGKGWMTEELILEWLREVWDRRAGALLKMLLLDSLKDIGMRKMETDFLCKCRSGDCVRWHELSFTGS